MVDPSIIISQCHNSVGCRMWRQLVNVEISKVPHFNIKWMFTTVCTIPKANRPPDLSRHQLLLDDNRLANLWSQCHIFCKVHIWLASSFLHLLGNETSPHWGRCRKILFPGVCRRWFSLFHWSEVSSLYILNSYGKEKKLLSKTKALHRHNL